MDIYTNELGGPWGAAQYIKTDFCTIRVDLSPWGSEGIKVLVGDIVNRQGLSLDDPGA